MNDLVSVIIPSHKAAPIRRCRDAVEFSTYKNIEIIVVDEGKERSAQRNIGIDRAKGKYLLILDSDQMVAQDLIEDCVKRIKYYGGIYIPEIIVTPGWFGRLRNWERQFYTGTAVDVARFVRAYQCPRFDESMSGPEDSDWDRRIIGGKIISKSCIYHYDDVSILSFFKKKAYYTKSMRRFKRKWPNDKILSFKWRCWTVFVEGGKWTRLLKQPHLAFAMFLIIFLRGIIYLCGRKS